MNAVCEGMETGMQGLRIIYLLLKIKIELYNYDENIKIKRVLSVHK